MKMPNGRYWVDQPLGAYFHSAWSRVRRYFKVPAQTPSSTFDARCCQFKLGVASKGGGGVKFLFLPVQVALARLCSPLISLYLGLQAKLYGTQKRTLTISTA